LHGKQSTSIRWLYACTYSVSKRFAGTSRRAPILAAGRAMGKETTIISHRSRHAAAVPIKVAKAAARRSSLMAPPTRALDRFLIDPIDLSPGRTLPALPHLDLPHHQHWWPGVCVACNRYSGTVGPAAREPVAVSGYQRCNDDGANTTNFEYFVLRQRCP